MNRFLILFTLLFTLSLASINAQPTYVIDNELFPDEHRQFDFWIGEWDVNLRRINPDNTWHDWKNSIVRIHPILDGKAILELWEDQYDGTPENVIIGYSLRYFYPKTGKWHLWLNWPGPNRSGSQPLEGQFRHGRGEFFRERPTSDSTTVLSRFTFSDISDSTLRWDDAFSQDGGKTWSNNWIMEFTRSKDRAPWDPENDQALHTYRHGTRCDQSQFMELRKFVGGWNGEVKYLNESGDWESSQAGISAYKALGGCSIISFLNYEKDDSMFREFSLKTFNTFAQKFEDGRLDNVPGTVYRPLFGDKQNDTIELVRINRETREPIEKYIWSFKNDEKMQLEKWELRNGKLTKTLRSEFKKN